MTAPQIGAEGWDGRAGVDDRWHLSASTIGKALAKSKLDSWAERRTAEVVVANIGMLGQLAAQNPGAAEEFVRTARYQGEPGFLGAADRGTALHAYIEARLTGEPADLPSVLDRCAATDSRFRQAERAIEQLTPFLGPIEEWLSTFMPEPLEVETVVYDPAKGLAGRLDFKLRLRGIFDAWAGVANPAVLIDGKSSDKSFDRYGNPTKPWADSHPLQLAALAGATHLATWTPRLTNHAGGRFYLANDAELARAVAPHPVDGAALLQITPEHCTLYPVDIGPETMAYCQAVATAWRWQNLVSKGAIGGAVGAAS